MANGRVTASHVGTAPVTLSDRRTCHRCGCERSVGTKNNRNKPYMCRDCKSVDPAMAKRLGLA